MASIGEDITKKLIENVEISQNMKILDLGCGNGDVSFLISKYIGNNGIVVGIDSNKNVISNAINKSKEFGLSNTNFILGDLTEDFQIEYSDFDVVIVRRVLMYLSNPIKTITNAIRYLKPNGIFLVQENDVSLTPINLEFMPEHKKIIEYIRKTLEKENVNFKIGFDLNSILTSCGLSVEKIWAEAVLSTPEQHTPWAFLAKVMKERMLMHNVISNESELDLENLSDKLYKERISNNITFISDLVFCAIGRKLDI